MSDRYTLHEGDCLEVLPTLEAGSVDAIITDLPYGTTACSWDEVIPFAPMWAEVKRVLKPRGVFVTTASQPFTSKLIMSNLDWFKYDWVWVKNWQTGIGYARYRPMSKNELISVFGIKKVSYYPIMQETESKLVKKFVNSGQIRTGSTNAKATPLKAINKTFSKMRNPSTVLKFDVVNHRWMKHPTQKPVPLLEYLIKTYTLENETVLDFTMGSGSTGVACVNLNRKFIGIEKDEKYFNTAKQRIEHGNQSKL